MRRNQMRKGGLKRGRQEDTWAADARDVSTLANDAFNRYYKTNVVGEAEWDAFMEALRRALPMAFRVHPSLSCADAVLEYLKSRLSSVLPVTQLPFVTEGAALQCAVSRGELKRSVELKALKKIIAAMNEGGYLTRQEAVSMLPPVLLQVRPGHRVLDMCAAPGSKTSQILEALLSSAEDGVVVANDINTSRLDVLLHQTNRSAGAHAHLIVTNHDATQFPLLPSEDKFDRVLCDVMCSGDGTLRKSVDMWPRWNTLLGANLHSTQIRVLLRGMMLCKKGGIVVYSTCSLNPVEDEAVVSECLVQSKNTFRLIDPTPLAPGLVAAPGLKDWSLLTRDLTTRLHTMEEAQTFCARDSRNGFSYVASMFPNSARLQEQNIHYTKRVLPHLQDTGGFFVAVMECLEEYPTPTAAPTSSSSFHGKGEMLKPLSPLLQEEVQAALGLPDSFPGDQLFVRNETAREQKIYFANKAVCAILPKLGPRVVHVGSKVFESYVKYSNNKLRFSAEGVGVLVPLLPPSFIVEISPETVLQLSQSKLAATSLPQLPPNHSFVFKSDMTVAGAVYIAAERVGLGQIAAKVADWQVTLAKLTLGQPLVEGNEEAGVDAVRVEGDGEP
ncbi:tRNA (cytosine34-C5)-methyltransferase [Trypanosoma rangeli]|uniref:tRNA (Cytosine34-C5)-methyltransferase n=1 Tax=Trypanosoma rangeli TaxID=5698 RepID=A0A3S5IQZ3_TRYRA|nr:tRNA (cytosine34-C5)-methyltransferase [Trypanosoma rangeli]RNF03345.1 tRNA (cytosine34-C5)-methyltransferase [Trypanosoma rangeli]|eukprot:RNF03345.1 tRNA (cytosine34-C5)-methyltransferase [Trypanosoma rangeli]